MSRAVLLLALAAALVAAAPAAAAEYKGRNIDRRTWHCTASNNDYGTFRNLDVRFDGERAYLTFPNGVRIVLVLDEERIVDPHAVAAYDHKRGVRWELDLLDLG